MTGEFYALLRQHSILARTLAESGEELDAAAFEQGLAHALRTGNLLHAAFSARTLALFDRLPAHAGPSYLSGLVIGEELRSQALEAADDPVVVVGSPVLTQRYELALRVLGLRCVTVGSEATWHGLWSIAQKLEGIA
jgi:2-dehydro-3-deoxygalactonokinase